MYSLKEAAESVGLGKPSILKAIQKGRISAKKNELGQWEIDPSELHRVYKAVAKEPSPAVASERQETAEVMELRTRLDMTDKLLGQVEGERDDLRRRLDEAEAARREAAAETRRLMLMLTHQPQPAAAATPRTSRAATQPTETYRQPRASSSNTQPKRQKTVASMWGSQGHQPRASPRGTASPRPGSRKRDALKQGNGSAGAKALK